MLGSVVDEHLDDSARVIKHADDLAIVKVSHIQLQVDDDVVHLEEEGVQSWQEQEAS
jgi:hypothetical protein